MSTETSASDQAAAKLRRMADEGGTIGSAMLQAIAVLRKGMFPNEAENLEQALLSLPSLVEKHHAVAGAVAAGTDRSGLQRTIAPHSIPEHLRDGLENYIQNGRETGGFLMALLENDLRDAVGRADPTSLVSLAALVRYLQSHAPTIAWGSAANVKSWMECTQAKRDDALKAMVFWARSPHHHSPHFTEHDGARMAKKGAGDKEKQKDAERQQRKALGDREYQLGPQEDGAIVVRIENDYDLMIARKALEKQTKNAGAAVGTVSALADGEDPFIDAVQRSLERTLKVLNRSRAPANQMKGTPIGEAIAEGERRASGTSGDEGTHHGGTRAWAKAIPKPRPGANDVVQFPDSTIGTIVDAIGFKGDGLEGNESDEQLQALADDGKLTGAFEVVVQGRDTNVLVVLHDEANGKTKIWRVQGAEYSGAMAAPEAPSGNLGTPVKAAVAKATGRKKVPVGRSGRIKTRKKDK